MDAGTVIKWSNFPDRQYDGEIKPRWFVYLGDTGPFSNIQIAYLFTATTQFNKLATGEIKEGHTYCSFDPNTSPFEQKCFIDVDEEPYYYSVSELKNNPNIKIIGKLSKQDAHMVYNKVYQSSTLSQIQIRDIYDSFIRVGIDIKKKPKL